jgi:hypothetical protein
MASCLSRCLCMFCQESHYILVRRNVRVLVHSIYEVRFFLRDPVNLLYGSQRPSVLQLVVDRRSRLSTNAGCSQFNFTSLWRFLLYLLSRVASHECTCNGSWPRDAILVSSIWSTMMRDTLPSRISYRKSWFWTNRKSSLWISALIVNWHRPRAIIHHT